MTGSPTPNDEWEGNIGFHTYAFEQGECENGWRVRIWAHSVLNAIFPSEPKCIVDVQGASKTDAMSAALTAFQNRGRAKS